MRGDLRETVDSWCRARGYRLFVHRAAGSGYEATIWQDGELLYVGKPSDDPYFTIDDVFRIAIEAEQGADHG